MRLNALGEDLNFFDGSLHRPASAGNPIACRMLLDCGASHTFVSLETAKRLGGKWDKRKSLPVSLPNGDTLYTQGTTNVVIRLGGWTGMKVVGAVDVEGYDVVLGNDFLCKHDPHVSFPTKKMWLTDRYGEHEGHPTNYEGKGHRVRGLLRHELQRPRPFNKRPTLGRTTPEVRGRLPR
ncbi:Retrovirus-related Pol polyprotein from transposon [Penicillium digitatum]|uniref:Retrovirus-related Pol polyprotein from transposon n=1 Tax=Penicillium digitatum TaxID=36651 RepID=A0A7T6XTW9_PENDI|nr:Retrovirus-related Pol polyprotein from transposon [Penicillium digitatum]QQK47141.1 Retrovirus-related Pol polyprotein from transposon [Penicillium digitatum]